MTALDRVWRVFAREVRAAVRTRSYLALALVTAVAVFGVAAAGGGPTGGYVPTVIDVTVYIAS